MTQSLCVCGSQRDFDACCEPILAGTPAPTAEALMRSRYAAYVLGNLDHLERTCTDEARATFDRADAEQTIAGTIWRGLDVRSIVAGGAEDDSGQVEFVVRYRWQGRTQAQHERAHFRREDGQWRYQRSDLNPKFPPLRAADRPSRNEPCPCGSGRKYKKCCGTG